MIMTVHSRLASWEPQNVSGQGIRTPGSDVTELVRLQHLELRLSDLEAPGDMKVELEFS